MGCASCGSAHSRSSRPFGWPAAGGTIALALDDQGGVCAVRNCMRAIITGAVLLAAACQPAIEGSPTRRIHTRAARTVDYFQYDKAGSWQVFTAPGAAALFRVSDGALEGAVAADRGYVWSLNGAEHADVTITAVVQQTQGADGSAFGLMCRADARGNGYYFLIGSDGTFTISVGTDARADLFQLVPWQASSAVKRGKQANSLRAVCVENYLALFINDVFAAETFDDEFTRGQAGVALGAVQATAWARFDDIVIQDAYTTGPR